jgi:hypothetical protein
MVRSLIAALALVALGGCFPRGIDPRTGRMTFGGTIVDPPEQEEQILHVTTAYAYAPEKVEQGPFDKRAAREALAQVDVTKCSATEDGHAKVTFAIDGTVTKVTVDWPQDLVPPTRECVSAELRKARVFAFDGQPITLGTSWRASR